MTRQLKLDRLYKTFMVDVIAGKFDEFARTSEAPKATFDKSTGVITTEWPSAIDVIEIRSAEQSQELLGYVHPLFEQPTVASAHVVKPLMSDYSEVVPCPAPNTGGAATVTLTSANSSGIQPTCPAVFNVDLYHKWLKYYVETERYDRSLSGVMHTDGFWRVLHHQEHLSRSHAVAFLKLLGLDTAHCKEKEAAGALSFERQVAELHRLDASVRGTL
jgi:hypothetical protein